MLTMYVDHSADLQMGPACEIRFRAIDGGRIPLPGERVNLVFGKGFCRMVDVATVAPNGFVKGMIRRVIR